jgi:RNA polymerase sigma-B factor
MAEMGTMEDMETLDRTEATAVATAPLVDDALRRRLVEEHIGLARYLARRFGGRGEPTEDLEQVAYVGLLLAAKRYDPSKGFEFVRFAAPTISGELKRHLRDKAWGAHVPRRIKELHLDVYQMVTALSQRLGRSPTVAELAVAVGATEEDVLEAMDAGRSYRPASLDVPAGSDGTGDTLGTRIGTDDAALDQVDQVTSVLPALARLPERDQELLRLRFYDGLTQSEIAERLGCSQVHVSRMLARALERVRREAGIEEPTG